MNPLPLQSIQQSQTPKLPVIPTKINVKTGSGVPGGFVARDFVKSIKFPSLTKPSITSTILGTLAVFIISI